MKETQPLLRPPHAGEWVRVNPDPASRREVVLAVAVDGTSYLVAEHMVEEVRRIAPGSLRPTMLFVAANKDGGCFLWPVHTPVPEQHLAYRAMEEWVCFPLLN